MSLGWSGGCGEAAEVQRGSGSCACLLLLFLALSSVCWAQHSPDTHPVSHIPLQTWLPGCSSAPSTGGVAGHELGVKLPASTATEKPFSFSLALPP